MLQNSAVHHFGPDSGDINSGWPFLQTCTLQWTVEEDNAYRTTAVDGIFPYRWADDERFGREGGG